MRAKGAIRIARRAHRRDRRRSTPEPGEAVIDASGCVIYPGLISTHHHLFQSVLKGVRAGIDVPLLAWLRAVPYSYWHKIDEEALRIAARIGLVELLLSGTTTAADHHYLFADSYRFDPAARDLRGGGRARASPGVLPRRRYQGPAASTRPISCRRRPSRSTA